MNITPHRETVEKLRPMTDSKFRYNPERWRNLNSNFVHFIKHFENLEISRQDVIASFENYYNGKSTWEIPFLLTMIWGFADTGYGTYRTNVYISHPDNQNLIQKSFAAVYENNLETAYKSLKAIKGLNISYISKVLYFASKACGHSNYALIYDIRVARSLIKLTAPPEIFEIVEIKPSSKFIHYQMYNTLMHKYAGELNLKADSLELFLFEQLF